MVIAKPDHLSHKPGFVATLMWSGVEFVATDMPFANSSASTSWQPAAKARGTRLGTPGPRWRRRRAQAAQFAANVLPIIRDVQAAGRASLNRRAAQCPEARMAMLDE